jgi:hypothetical protein
VTTEPTDLLGDWLLEREVDDRLSGERRHVTGTTTLEQLADDHVRWREEGVMTWAGHEVPVERTLDVRRDGDGWAVHFSDGRFFHPWQVGAPVEHPCAPDHYTGRIDVADDRAGWTVEWHSRGPAKDYVLRSRLSRG